MLIAKADGHDVIGVTVGGSIEQPEALWPLAGKVELDPGQPGEIAADSALAELLAGHSAVGKVFEHSRHQVEYGDAIIGQMGDVAGDVGVEGEPVSDRRRGGLGITQCGGSDAAEAPRPQRG